MSKSPIQDNFNPTPEEMEFRKAIHLLQDACEDEMILMREVNLPKIGDVYLIASILGDDHEPIQQVIDGKVVEIARPEGTIEYQVSDGPVRYRSHSDDFYHLHEAVECFKNVVKSGWGWEQGGAEYKEVKEEELPDECSCGARRKHMHGTHPCCGSANTCCPQNAHLAYDDASVPTVTHYKGSVLIIHVSEITNPYLDRDSRALNVEEYVGTIRVSLGKIGQLNPVILNMKNEVVPGGGRYLFEALKLAGVKSIKAIVKG